MSRRLHWFVATALVALVAACAPPASHQVTTVRTATEAASFQPPLLWSGALWVPRAGLNRAPYHNTFSPRPDEVFVDSGGHLHLRIRRVAGHWVAASVTDLSQQVGYGVYTFVVRTPLSHLDPNAVLGMFTYNSRSPSPNRYVDHDENDIELSQWGWGGYPFNTQFAVQPFWRPNRHLRVHAPTTGPTTYRMTWAPSGVRFELFRGTQPSTTPVVRWFSPFQPGPQEPGTHVAINFWLYNPATTNAWSPHPQSGSEQEMVLDSFSYQPASRPDTPSGRMFLAKLRAELTTSDAASPGRWTPGNPVGSSARCSPRCLSYQSYQRSR